MLDTFRKNTKVIVWTVVIAFVAWGGYTVSSQLQKQTMYAGNIFGKEVSFQEFDRFYRSSQIFGGEKPATDPAVIRQTAWQGLIFSREAKKRNIEVSDDEVRREIMTLLDRYKIAPQNYEGWVERGLRSTAAEFESQIREVLRIQKLMQILQESITGTVLTDEEAHAEYLRENNKIAVELLAFPSQKEAADFRATIKKPEDWDKAIEPKRNDLRQTELIPAEVLPAVVPVMPADAAKLHAMEKGMVSEPIDANGNFMIFRILDKQTADEKAFAAEKDDYKKKLAERKIQMGLQEKALGIISSANLKDYQPAPATAPAPPAV